MLAAIERMYTTDEIAKIAHVSDWTARRWIRDGKLKAKKVGRSFLVKESEIVRFLEQLEEK